MNKFTSGAAFPDLSPTINNFTDNLVRLKVHQDNVDFRARQMEARQPILDAQVAEAQMKMEKMERDRAQAQQPVDLTVHPMMLSMPEETRPQILDFFRQNGLVNERGIGTMEGLTRGVGMIENSKPLFESFMGPVVQAKKNTVIKAFDALTKAQESGDPKKIQNAQAEFERVNMQYQSSVGSFDKHLETLSKHQQAMELEELKNEGRVDLLNQRLDMQGKLQDERLQSQRELRLMSAARGRGGAGDKEINQAVSKIRQFQKSNLTGKIKDFERKRDNALKKKKDVEADGWQMNIDRFQAEYDKSENTINQLLNGEISPGEIQWGGGRQVEQPARQPQQQAQPSGMNTLPPASQHSGRTIRDSKTGIRYKSNGKSWVRQ